MSKEELFNTLEKRGYIYQCTNLGKVKEILSSGVPQTFYLGIDPTADSLHIGHFFALMMFRYFQDAGHKGILVIGGATALIGDPSARNDMRKILTKEQVNYNLNEVKELSKRFIKTTGENPAIILNNEDWLKETYVDFMRNVGIHFNVNKMLAADAYANRLKAGGLTFLEMGYMLMQAYDFVYLNKNYGCTMQIGGSDQWGNIVAGTTLNRKLNNLSESNEFEIGDIFGLTCPLLLTKEGKKMGKTETGTLWVARDKTTPYEFYQYFYNVLDNDVEMLLKLFTRVSLEEIEVLIKNDIIAAKKIMAYEITKLVHGEEEANKVLDAVSTLFGNSNNTENLPKIEINKSEITNGINICDLLVKIAFLPSKSEVRRMILQNALWINDDKITDIDYCVTLDLFKQDYVIIRKGKKTFIKVSLI